MMGSNIIKPGETPLTAKQQRIWDLKTLGKTNKEVAAELGITENVVEKQVTAIYRKRGKPANNDKRMTDGAVVPVEPGNAVLKVNEAMIEAGLPERLRMAHIRRLKVKHLGEVTPAQAIADDAMKTGIREKIGLALSYMDDKTMSEASFRDLSIGTTALIEKLQLLEGKPTQIISDLERKKLHELLPLLLEEGKRRGITLDGQVTEKVVSPA